MAADTNETLAHGWDTAKSFTFEKRADFQANAKALTSKMDAQMGQCARELLRSRLQRKTRGSQHGYG